MSIYNSVIDFLLTYRWYMLAAFIFVVFLVLVLSIAKYKKVSKIKKTSVLCKKIAELNKLAQFNDYQSEFLVSQVMYSQLEYLRINTYDIFLWHIKDNLDAAGNLLECIEQNISVYKIYTRRYNELWQLASPDKRTRKIEKKLFDKSRRKCKTDVTFKVTCIYQSQETGSIFQRSTVFHFDTFRTFYIKAGGVIANHQPEEQQEQREEIHPSASPSTPFTKGSVGTPPKDEPKPKPKTIHLELYKYLELDNTATQEQIKIAYRTLAKKYHPDLHGGDPFFVERLKQLNHAYTVLGDPASRTLYDIDGKE